MVKSKRAIQGAALRILSISIISLTVLAVSAAFFWHQAVYYAQEKGPRIVEQRLGRLLAKKVTISALKLSFPPQVSLSGLIISLPAGKETIMAAPRLDVKFSISGILSGKIRPKEITITSPKFNLSQETSSPLMLGLGLLPSLSQRAASDGLNNQKSTLKPSSWPLQILPKSIHMVDGTIHLEDESDTIPQLDGHFDLSISASRSDNLPGIDSAFISIRDSSFFYRGLSGEASGTIKLANNTISTFFRCTPEGGGRIDIQTTKRDIRATQTHCSFQVKSKGVNLGQLALLKFPLITPANNSVINGSISANESLLYNIKIPSLTAAINYNHGRWGIKAINLQFGHNQGGLSGTITPNKGPKIYQATARLTYKGNTPPNLQTYGEELKRLNPLLWEKPIFLSSELTIDLDTYPLKATSLKVTGGKNGDIFANGIINLYSGIINMTGTYLQPLAAGKHSTEEIRKNVTPMTITGPISQPEIRRSTDNQ